MTYTVKHKPLPGSPMLCEYDCPHCGIFEKTVKRDEHGDPPSHCCCPFEREDELCNEPSPLVMSAASIKFWSRNPVPIGYASKSDEKDPRALDTEPLATGKMTRAEWNKYQRGISNERRYQKRLKAGRISKRIQVGGG